MRNNLCILLMLAAVPLGAAERRLNVLFIASDDMRPQLGCYGDPNVKSPNIDRLAARGMLFERAYCQEALCSPSRISLLSGRHPWSTGIYDIGPALRSTMPDIVTLPQLFKNNGWHARSLGKIFHVGIDDPASWSVPSWVSRVSRMGPEGSRLAAAVRKKQRDAGIEDPDRGPGKAFYAGPAFEAPDCADEELCDGDAALTAVAALQEYAKKPEQPFFLAVGFVNPHVPWVAPKKYFDLYHPADLKIPENNYPPQDAPEYAARSGDDFYWYGNVPRDRKISADFGRSCLHGYLAAISYVDGCVGRVVNELDRLGLSDNTVIVFWGDHGYYMGEHSWWGGKHNNYEGATRAPLIICAPGMKAAGRKTAALVEFVDIFPTLAALAGLTPPAGLEGTSLAPLLDNPEAAWNKAAFSEYPKNGRRGIAMRTDRYRYVEWRDKAGSVVDRELYDHLTDPQENQNIAGREENTALVDKLGKQLLASVPPHAVAPQSAVKNKAKKTR